MKLEKSATYFNNETTIFSNEFTNIKLSTLKDLVVAQHIRYINK